MDHAGSEAKKVSSSGDSDIQTIHDSGEKIRSEAIKIILDAFSNE